MLPPRHGSAKLAAHISFTALAVKLDPPVAVVSLLTALGYLSYRDPPAAQRKAVRCLSLRVMISWIYIPMNNPNFFLKNYRQSFRSLVFINPIRRSLITLGSPNGGYFNP